MNIEEFKKQNKPKRTSKLMGYKKEISMLYKDSYSLSSIQEFLKKNRVKTTIQNIHKFIQKNIFTDINKNNECKNSTKTTSRNKDENTSWEIKISQTNPILKALEGEK